MKVLFVLRLAECESNPSSAPLVLWLNGGPGSSSIGGMFEENGPYRMNPDNTVHYNPYSWTKVAHNKSFPNRTIF